MTSFVSVSTGAARIQDISLNPQKLAGQCAKLKCCLNYEIDCYVESQKHLPSKEISLFTLDGEWFFFKADILANQITYSTDKQNLANAVTISCKRAFEIIGMNKRGIKPDSLLEDGSKQTANKTVDLVEQESLTRFDRAKKKKKKKSGDKAKSHGNSKSHDNAEMQGSPKQPKREHGQGGERNKEFRDKRNKQADKRQQA